MPPLLLLPLLPLLLARASPQPLGAGGSASSERVFNVSLHAGSLLVRSRYLLFTDVAYVQLDPRRAAPVRLVAAAPRLACAPGAPGGLGVRLGLDVCVNASACLTIEAPGPVRSGQSVAFAPAAPRPWSWSAELRAGLAQGTPEGAGVAIEGADVSVARVAGDVVAVRAEFPQRVAARSGTALGEVTAATVGYGCCVQLFSNASVDVELVFNDSRTGRTSSTWYASRTSLAGECQHVPRSFVQSPYACSVVVHNRGASSAVVTYFVLSSHPLKPSAQLSDREITAIVAGSVCALLALSVAVAATVVLCRRSSSRRAGYQQVS
eukprot:m51a1_g7882 putative C-tail anchored protein (322) ;mRNA; f:54318-55455